MAKRHVIKIRLSTTKTNISLQNCKIGSWFLNWQNNEIIAYAQTNYTSGNISEPFNLVTRTTTLNLGFLIDALTLSVNQEVNTSIVISTQPEILVYESKEKSIKRVTSVSDAISFIRNSTLVCNASTLGEEKPKRIDESITVNLNDEQLRVMEYLLDFFKRKKSFTKVNYKLLNYWRKGVDLDQLLFIDESYLSFFKIIEYFINKSNLSDDAIPKKYKKTNSLKDAYKFANGASLSNFNNDQYEMIADFVHIRNNWDIAHVTMNVSSNEKIGGLYYSHMDSIWDYHSHICQISRWVILKAIGVKDLMLEVDGGLFKLNFTK